MPAGIKATVPELQDDELKAAIKRFRERDYDVRSTGKGHRLSTGRFRTKPMWLSDAEIIALARSLR